jgi:hypothetical protein
MTVERFALCKVRPAKLSSVHGGQTLARRRTAGATAPTITRHNTHRPSEAFHVVFGRRRRQCLCRVTAPKIPDRNHLVVHAGTAPRKLLFALCAAISGA